MSPLVRSGRLLSLLVAAVVGGVLGAAVLLPVVGGTGLALRSASSEVSPLKLTEPPLAQRTKILAADGSVLTSFYQENRTDVSIDKIAPIMQQAIVSIEDSRFYQHGAIDIKGTIRALIKNNENGGTVQGGSSITQQYVKNVQVEVAARQLVAAEETYSNARTKAAKKAAQAAVDKATAERQDATAVTFDRKLKELRYALWVEQHYSKSQILDKYLNIAYFGHQTYGIEAAAERYFGVHAAQLTLAQAATLAGMVNNANQYDPIAQPAATRQRRDTVLARMAQLGYITQAQSTQAAATKPTLHQKVVPGSCDGVKYAYFCTYVQDEVLTNPVFGSTATARQDLLQTGGLTIQTTLDPKVQDAVQRQVERHSSPASRRVTMEAMVQPGTGRIQAIAISRKYGTGTHQTTIDYAADKAHGGAYGVQAGSTFKLFTLAAALKAGYSPSKTFSTPAAISLSGFRDCSGNGLGTWNVHNSEKSTAPSMTMEEATWDSVNTYYAQLEREVGLCNVMKLAADFGMTAPDGSALKAVPSFTLGADEIDIIHEAAAYAGIAAEGQYCKPVAITSVTDGTGKRLAVPSAGCKQVVSKSVADTVTGILAGVITKGTAKGNAIPGQHAAGKTGTNENETTALFAGYTANLAAVVWYGNPAAPVGDPVYAFGASLAPTWRRSLEAAQSAMSN